ncbi:protein ACCELERATED CELL DEATH 6-like [Prosopis cineraria]|uniref:protein ACCELERATED CELL DEATH 6-like n=1 Tax=Prosopis cineraria TaxID=364024 RepID=UPI00241074B2|nr:protein ACCELERATED CELL DEATH 6-like [Prosopis cineraria]
MSHSFSVAILCSLSFCPFPLELLSSVSLKELVKVRPELIYLRDQKDRTPLHCAASIGYLEGVQTIVNASPQSRVELDKKGYLPIHVACKEGHFNVVQYFIQRTWFDPMDLQNQKGQNILHIAAKRGKDAVVKYILGEKKLENLLNEKDKNGNTPLHLASKYLHLKVLLLLTQEKKLNVNLVNNEGLTARDIVIQRRNTAPTFREYLSFAMLRSVGVPLSEKGRRIRRLHAEQPHIKWIKDRVSSLLLVAILVAAVTFAAGFTVPGGVYDSNDIDTKRSGMATLVKRKMFQVFTICDVIAMYSSTMGSFILLWAQLGDFHMAFSATYFALNLVGLAIVSMSIAFMAAVNLVVNNLTWLANIVMIIGIIFLLMFLGLYIPLIYPLGAHPCFFPRITNFIFRMIIPFSGSYGIKVKKAKALKVTKEDKDSGNTSK